MGRLLTGGACLLAGSGGGGILGRGLPRGHLAEERRMEPLFRGLLLTGMAGPPMHSSRPAHALRDTAGVCTTALQEGV